MARFKVNMNGDTALTLVKQYQSVVEEARELENALRNAAPNGRNYQTCESDVDMLADMEEWKIHLKAVRDVQDWATANSISAFRQGEKK